MVPQYDFFYDQQIRRFLLQMQRALSGFQYQIGRRGELLEQNRIVPVTTATSDKQAAMIRQNASENVLNSAPMISVYISDLAFEPDRLQNPGHVGKVHALERSRDEVTGLYSDKLGTSITVERLMPRPFRLTIKMDLWTSNMDQKLQLLEQICPMVFPSFDIQNSDNALDWSALTTCFAKDIVFSSRSIPIGTDDSIDVSTITFEIPIMLNPPAKITRSNNIESIITNIHHSNDLPELGEKMGTEVTTLGDHHIEISNGTIRLLGPKTNPEDSKGNPYDWTNLFDKYSKPFSAGTTQLRIRNEIGSNQEIIGKIYQTTNGAMLDWQIDIDTLPSNTLPNINAVIDPKTIFPNNGITPVIGNRYLLIDDLATSVAWGNFGARKNQIIELKTNGWEVIFQADDDIVQYVVNTASGKQLKWNGIWTTAIDGIYAPGFWRIIF